MTDQPHLKFAGDDDHLSVAPGTKIKVSFDVQIESAVRVREARPGEGQGIGPIPDPAGPDQMFDAVLRLNGDVLANMSIVLSAKVLADLKSEARDVDAFIGGMLASRARMEFAAMLEVDPVAEADAADSSS